MRSSTSTPEKVHAVNPLVPCRGCTADCIYISNCEGKPWRMTDATVSKLLEKSNVLNPST